MRREEAARWLLKGTRNLWGSKSLFLLNLYYSNGAPCFNFSFVAFNVGISLEEVAYCVTDRSVMKENSKQEQDGAVAQTPEPPQQGQLRTHCIPFTIAAMWIQTLRSSRAIIASSDTQ